MLLIATSFDVPFSLCLLNVTRFNLAYSPNSLKVTSFDVSFSSFSPKALCLMSYVHTKFLMKMGLTPSRAQRDLIFLRKFSCMYYLAMILNYFTVFFHNKLSTFRQHAFWGWIFWLSSRTVDLTWLGDTQVKYRSHITYIIWRLGGGSLNMFLMVNLSKN